MCNVPCELCADNGECDISHYCENNLKYYCCAKDDCKPDKNYYPDKDCKKNKGLAYEGKEILPRI